MLENELQQFGLTEKEAKVYVAILELGKASIQEIAKKSGVNRATTYIQVDSLISRGLISSVEIAKKNLIIAERPQRILEILDKQKNQIEKQESKFIKLMPDLNSIFNAKEDKPRVRFYENEAGLEMVRNDMFKLKPPVIYSIIPKMKDSYIPEINNNAEKVNQYNFILLDKVRPELTEKFRSNIDFRYYKQDDFDIEITIYLNKVFINKPIEFDNNLGVLIEDKIVAESFLAIFNLFWSLAK